MTNNKEDEDKNPIFSDKVYNQIKYAAQYWLPGLGALYAALAALWGFPYATEVVGSIAAIDIFLGVLLGLGAASYNKSDAKFDGSLNVTQTDNGQFHALQLNEGQYQALPSKGEITLKVNNVENPSAGTTDPRLLS